MAKVEDCPGFETFGADVKAAREAKRLARKTLAEMVGIEWRYLANIENQGAIPSLPVMIQLIKICGLPVERYFNPEIMREESEQRQRVSHKLNTLRSRRRTHNRGLLLAFLYQVSRHFSQSSRHLCWISPVSVTVSSRSFPVILSSRKLAYVPNKAFRKSSGVFCISALYQSFR